MPDQPAQTDQSIAFGPNSWFVDELYEQYQEDKNSVDRSWWAVFENYTPGQGSEESSGSSASSSVSSSAASNGTGPSAPADSKPAASKPAASKPADAKSADSTTDSKTAAHKTETTQGASGAPEKGRAVSDVTTHPKADQGAEKGGAAVKNANVGAESTASNAAAHETSPSASTDFAPQREPKSRQMPKPRDTPALKASASNDEESIRPLKGPAARIVANMDASLSVPTATSVRAVPAQALIENRIAINDHLRRRTRRGHGSNVASCCLCRNRSAAGRSRLADRGRDWRGRRGRRKERSFRHRPAPGGIQRRCNRTRLHRQDGPDRPA